MKNRMIIGTAVIVLLGALVAVLGIKNITAPIQAVINGMVRLQHGELDQPAVRHRSVGQTVVLVDAFNEMLRRMRVMIDNECEQRILGIKMEYKILRNQMNPHFLYNTLEQINWEACSVGSKEVCDQIQSLTRMLDYNLDRNDDDYVNVQDEINYLNEYINILRRKFGQRFTFCIEVPEEVKSLKMPKMILQPIVENAVYHGLYNKIGKGSVQIRCEIYADHLRFTVEDDGVGIDKSRMEELLHAAEHPAGESISSGGHGIALRNIFRRLKLIYGERCVCKIESVPFTATTITLEIPTGGTSSV